MKKSSIMKFIVLTVMCLMSMFNLGTVAHAATPFENEQNTIVSDRIDERRASVRNASSYKITIPTYIEPEDYGTTQYKNQYVVSVSNMLVPDGTKLNVNVNYDGVLTENNNIGLPYRLYNNNKEVVDGQTIISMVGNRNNSASSSFFIFNSAITEKPKYAGLYKDTVTFNATLIHEKAFAVYSADDQSLNFYRREQVPAVGSQFEGKTVTKVYTDVERTGTFPGWADSIYDESTGNSSANPNGMGTANVKSVTIVDKIYPTNCSCWFLGFNNTINMDLKNLDTSRVTDMSDMFEECTSLQTLDVSSFDTSQVQNMSFMFTACTSLQTLDLSCFDTSRVMTMESMFTNCSSLTQLDVSNFDTSQVVDMLSMFDGCSSLTSLDLSNFNAMNVEYMSYMFCGCTNLKTIKTPYNIIMPDIYGITSKTFYDITDNNKEYVAGDFPIEIKNSHVLSDVKQEVAFAVYSRNSYDDVSLNFYKRADIPTEGSQFDGRVVTKIYPVNEKDKSFVPGWTQTLDKEDITSVKVVDKISPASCYKWFDGFKKLKTVDLKNLDTSNTVTMDYMFNNCVEIQGLDLSSLNATKVDTMKYMFSGCDNLLTIMTPTNINNPLLKGITSKSYYDVSDSMKEYKRGTFTTNITDSHILTDSAIKKEFAVYSADDQSFNFYSRHYVPIKYDQFEGKTITEIYTDINWWGFYQAGYYCSWSSDIFNGLRDVKNVTVVDKISPTACSAWFRDFKNAKFDLKNLDTSNVKYMNAMFQNCYSLTEIDLNHFDTSNVIEMNMLFANCENLKSVNMRDWNVENCIHFSSMFIYCSSLQFADLSNWTLSKVKPIYNTSEKFLDNSSSKTFDLNKWNTLNLKSIEHEQGYYDVDAGMKSMFYGCSSLTQLDISKWDVQNVTNMSYMFLGCSSLMQLDASSLNTSNVTNMSGMFSGCSSLTQLDVRTWNVSNVEDMGGMFSECSSLAQLDVSKWDTSQATNMADMFSGCSLLIQLDVSKWDTSQATKMNGMFSGCSLLTQLDVSKWNTSQVTDMSGMFEGCASLKSINVNHFDINKLSSSYTNGMFSRCTSLTEIDLSKWEITDKYFRLNSMFNGCTNLKMIKTPKILIKLYFDIENITSKTFYDITDGDKEYIAGSFPTNTTISHTLVDIKPISQAFAIYSADDNSFNFYKREQVPIVGSQFNGKTVTNIYLINESIDFVPSWGEIKEKVVSVNAVDKIYPVNCSGWFSGFINAETITVDKIDTSNAKNMSNMFTNCAKVQSLDLSSFDVSKVTDMNYMFNGCTNLKTINTPYNIKTPKMSDITSIGYYDATNLNNFYIAGTFPSTTSKSHILTNIKQRTAFAVYSYTDKSLNFYKRTEVPQVGAQFEGKHVTGIYPVDENASNNNERYGKPDWSRNSYALSVKFVDKISPIDCENWFSLQAINSIDLKNLDTSKTINMSGMFSGCSSLTQLDVNSLNTSNVTNMSYMFSACSSLMQLDVNSLNTSNVTNMSYMFSGCSSLMQLDVNSLNTSNVTNMSYMFSRCSSLIQLDVSKLNTSKVKDMADMFAECSALFKLDLSNFDTSNVKSMVNMFSDCKSLSSINLTSFNTSNVKFMDSMFFNCLSLSEIDLSNFNASNVVSMTDMFNGTVNYVSNLKTIKTPYNIKKPKMYEYRWQTESEYNMTMKNFYDVSDNYKEYTKGTFPNNITTSHTLVDKEPTGLKPSAFAVYSADDQSLNFYRRKQVPIIGSQFEGKTVTKVYTDVENVDISQSNIPWNEIKTLVTKVVVVDKNIMPKNCSYWFAGFSNLKTLNIKKLDTSKVINMSHMFEDCSSLTDLNTGDKYSTDFGFLEDYEFINTSSVEDMSYMFSNCSSLKELEIDHFKLTNVINASHMFNGCENLEAIRFPGYSFYYSKDMSGMFKNCKKLYEIDMYCTYMFSTSQVTNMSSMFEGCYFLTKIRGLEKYDTSNVTNMSRMFAGCENLETLDLSTFDASKVTDMSEMFLNCTSLNVILTPKNINTPNVDNVTSKTFFDETNNEVYITGTFPTNISTSHTLSENYLGNRKTFAIYSATDNSLNFYKRNTIPNVGNMFRGREVTKVYTGFETLVNSKKVSPWDDIKTMVTNIEVVDLGISPIDCSYWFAGFNKLRLSDFRKLDTRNVKDMSYMFYNCTILGNYYVNDGIAKFNTSNVTNMSHMFDGCKAIGNMRLSWNTSKVTDTSYMFKDCRNGLNEDKNHIFDLSSFDATNIINMNYMFDGCIHLTEIKTPKNIKNPNMEGITSKTFYDITDNNKVYVAGTFPTNTTESHELSIEKKKMSFAIYSADDQSFNFYKREQVPAVGSQFEGKTVTKVYKDIENITSYTPEWLDFKFDISIGGLIPNPNGVGTANVKSVRVVDKISPTNCRAWFVGFENVTNIDLFQLDAINVESMSFMFANCSSLQSLKYSSFTWDTRNVRDMVRMFYGCLSLTQLDISNWDTSDVTDMSGMFEGCASLTQLNIATGSYNTKNIKNVSNMFAGCTSLTTLDLSGFNALNVTNMNHMFEGCTNLNTIKTPYNIKTPSMSSITSKTFYDATDGDKEYLAGTFPTNIPTSHTLGVGKTFAIYSASDSSLKFYKANTIPNVGSMFRGREVTKVYTGFETLVNSKKVSPWDDIKTMVTNIEVVDLGISPIDCSYWFAGFNKLETTNFDKLNVINVENMSNMFAGCSSLTQIDLSNLNILKVTNMSYMFNECTNLTNIKTPKNIKNPNMEGITSKTFYDITDSNKEYVVGTFPTNTTESHELIIEKQKMSFAIYSADDQSFNFYKREQVPAVGSQFEGKSVTKVYKDIENITSYTPEWLDFKFDISMGVMIPNQNGVGATNVKSVTVVDKISPTNCMGWFFGFNNTINIDLKNLDTSQVTNMSSMFSRCTSLQTLDLSCFDTTQVTDMSSMFSECSSLTSLDLSNFNAMNVEYMSYMFYGCTNLKTIKTPYNITMPDIYCITSKTFYDDNDGFEYIAGEFPTNIVTSHTLVDTRP